MDKEQRVRWLQGKELSDKKFLAQMAAIYGFVFLLVWKGMEVEPLWKAALTSFIFLAGPFIAIYAIFAFIFVFFGSLHMAVESKRRSLQVIGWIVFLVIIATMLSR